MKDYVHKKTEGSFVTNGCLFPQQHVEEVLESLYGLVIQVMKKKNCYMRSKTRGMTLQHLFTAFGLQPILFLV